MVSKKFVRKVNQQGNSLSVGIPKELVEILNIKKGDELEIIFNEKNCSLEVKLRKAHLSHVSPEVLVSLDKVMTQYESTLKKLKSR